LRNQVQFLMDDGNATGFGLTGGAMSTAWPSITMLPASLRYTR
jgi:hypothetical protein